MHPFSEAAAPDFNVMRQSLVVTRYEMDVDGIVGEGSDQLLQKTNKGLSLGP